MSGNIGYIKNKNITEKDYKRVDMKDADFTSNAPDISNSIEISKKNLSNSNLINFSARKEKIQNIISDIVSSGKLTVNLNLSEVEVENEKLQRFVIELMPRLKEIGAKISLTNNSILSNDFLTEIGLS